MTSPSEPPLPRHLREIGTDYHWDGRWPYFDTRLTIVCPCGSNEFNAVFAGETKEGSSGQRFMNPARIGVRCVSCSVEHLVFDEELHGWNGVVATPNERRVSTRKPFDNLWVCDCGSAMHSVLVVITHNGSDLDEGGVHTNSNNWFEAFDQFGLHVKCVKCGKQEYVAGYET